MLYLEESDQHQYEMDLGGRRDPRGMSPLDMVKEFSERTGQQPDSFLYGRLIAEEFEEFFDAYSDINELKELADLVYVAYGFANAKGWDLDEAVRRVHENNLGRCIQPDGSIQRREDGKIVKNKDYPHVYLEDLV